MQQYGLAEILTSVPKLVYIGLSSGSMVVTPSIGKPFVGWKPPDGTNKTLGLVNSSIFPHLDHEALPENILANAKKWGGSDA